MMNTNGNTNSKQTIIGFVLITLIFIGFVFYNNYQQARYQEAATQAAAEQIAEQMSAAAVAEPAVQESSETLPAVPSNATSATKEAVTEEGLFALDKQDPEELIIETDVMTICFSSLGGRITDVTLKDYTRYAPRGERNYLVHLFDPESARFDLSFYLRRDLRNVRINTMEHIFRLGDVRADVEKQIVTMTLPVGDDASIDYIYTIYNVERPERDYLVDFEVRLNNLAPLMANQTSIGIDWTARTYRNERSFKNENTYTTLAYHHGGDRSISDLGLTTSSTDKKVSSSLDWVSFKQQFFSTTLIARSTDFTYADLAMQTADEKSGYIKDFSMRSAVAYTPQTDGYRFSYYLGPNKYAVLSKVADEKGESLEMERIIPLGWVISSLISRWVVIPVFDFLCRYISSFGLIILILTLAVRLVIFPLTYKSYLSTAKMRVLKPEMDAIAAKYPRTEDNMKKQQATMELYKRAGINPMGGCIPALIQMPVFIAMFRFFPSSIELRGQSFLWSHDLSSYDSVLQLPFNIPFYGDHVSLFALLMALVFFAFSYMNYQQTASSQPQMAGMKFMMVYMMPLMMLLWFNDYASGLCYYYLLSNLFTIVQTFIMRRCIDDNKIHAALKSKIATNKGRKSRFQLKYEELLQQQQQKK